MLWSYPESRRSGHAAWVVGVLAVGLLLACTGDNGDDYGYDPGGGYDRGPVGGPVGGRVVAEGRGHVDFVADADGTWTVANLDHRRAVASGPIGRGQRLTVHPDEDRITIDGHVVFDRNLERDAAHQILFEPRGGGYGYPGPGHPEPGPYDPGPGHAHGPGDPNVPPRWARVVREGRDELRFVARDRGRLWVVDRNRDRIIWATPMGRGDEVILKPDDNRILINGKKAADFDIKSNHSHQFLFARE